MRLIQVGTGFDDPWIDAEGSGGSGDDANDVIFLPTAKTATTSTSSPADVTTVVSSVIRYVTTTVSTVTQEQEERTNVSASGIVNERLYVFIGVLLGLVALAVGICVYIRYFHDRKDTRTITPITR